MLAALNIDKHRYDVTAEQARSAKARLACPLSALSARMRYLQDELLAPTVPVRLAADAKAERARIETACAAGADKPVPAEIMHSAAGLLRRFLPPEEGGVDQGAAVAGANIPKAIRKDLFALELVPWSSMPPQFLDPKRFPANIELGQRIRTLFAQPFVRSAQEPGRARDLLLRGRYSSAITQLVSEQEHWREQQKQRANTPDIDRSTSEWVEHAIRAYAAQLRGQAGADEQVRAMWGERAATPVLLLLNSAIAAARNPEITYLLGLCMQEQAEQVQARLDLQARHARHQGASVRCREGPCRLVRCTEHLEALRGGIPQGRRGRRDAAAARPGRGHAWQLASGRRRLEAPIRQRDPSRTTRLALPGATNREAARRQMIFEERH